MVEDYRAARERDEIKRDEVTIGYEADEALYDGPMVTFKSWLTQIAGQDIYTRTPQESEN